MTHGALGQLVSDIKVHPYWVRIVGLASCKVRWLSSTSPSVYGLGGVGVAADGHFGHFAGRGWYDEHPPPGDAGGWSLHTISRC